MNYFYNEKDKNLLQKKRKKSIRKYEKMKISEQRKKICKYIFYKMKIKRIRLKK